MSSDFVKAEFSFERTEFRVVASLGGKGKYVLEYSIGSDALGNKRWSMVQVDTLPLVWYFSDIIHSLVKALLK